MCHYLGGGLHGRQKRVKAQSESSKSVVNSVLISREMPVFPGFLEIIRVVWVKIIMICGISGCLCSLIDKLFWGGSLDFLQIPTLFIFDLKDCYLTVAEVIFVAIGILNSKEISVKEYLHFCCNKFSL